MPLIVPLFPGRNRLLNDGNAPSYLVLHNLEEGGSSQGANGIIPTRRNSYEQEEKTADDDVDYLSTPAPAKNDEELWSEVLAFVREESLHCFSNDELRKALMGNMNNDSAASLVVVVGDEETSTRRHLNIDFCKVNSATSIIMEGSAAAATTPQARVVPAIDDDTSAKNDDDDDDDENSTTRKLRCLSTLSQPLRLIHKVSSQRLLSSNPFLSSAGGNLAASTSYYCRME